MKTDGTERDPEAKAIRLLDRGDLRRAERTLRGMLDSDPRSLPAHFHLARLYRRTKRYQRALHHGRLVLKLNPEERNARLNLGLIYEFLGNDKRAIFYYKEELSRNPNSAETLYNIGRLYFNRHRWHQASEYLARCFDSGYAYQVDDTVDKLALCYRNRGDVRSYVSLFARYLKKFPKAFWAAANLGRALMHVGDNRGAVRWLSVAARRSAKKDVLVDLAHARKMLDSENGKTTNR